MSLPTVTALVGYARISKGTHVFTVVGTAIFLLTAALLPISERNGSLKEGEKDHADVVMGIILTFVMAMAPLGFLLYSE